MKTVVYAVNLCECLGCTKSFGKISAQTQGGEFNIDWENNEITVTGDFDENKVLKSIRKVKSKSTIKRQQQLETEEVRDDKRPMTGPLNLSKSASQKSGPSGLSKSDSQRSGPSKMKGVSHSSEDEDDDD